MKKSDLIFDEKRVDFAFGLYTTHHLIIYSGDRLVFSFPVDKKHANLFSIHSGKYVLTWPHSHTQSTSEMTVWDITQRVALTTLTFNIPINPVIAEIPNTSHILISAADNINYQIWDFKNPSQPKKISAFEKSNPLPHKGIAFNGDTLFIALGNVISIYQRSGFTNFYEHTFLFPLLNGDIYTLALQDNYLISRHNSKDKIYFEIRDISDLKNLAVVETITPKETAVSNSHVPIRLSSYGEIITELDVKLPSESLLTAAAGHAIMQTLDDIEYGDKTAIPIVINKIILSYLFKPKLYETLAKITPKETASIKAPTRIDKQSMRSSS